MRDGPGMSKTSPVNEVVLVKIVMPGQANAIGTLFGGVALAMMDEATAIVALRRRRRPVAHGRRDPWTSAPRSTREAVEVTARLKSVGRTSGCA